MCTFKHSNSAKDLTRLVFRGTEFDLDSLLNLSIGSQRKEGHIGTPVQENPTRRSALVLGLTNITGKMMGIAIDNICDGYCREPYR